MPYFEKKHKRFRAVVRYKRERYTATFQTKREAVEWENEKRKELKAAKKMQGDMDLMTFCIGYLDHAQRYVEDEILSLLLAENRKNQLILLLFLETPGRRNEIFTLTVQDINMEKMLVRLWTRKTKDGSREGEWLPISKRLVEELKWWFDSRPLKKSIWLFPNPRTGKAYVDPRKWLSRLCKRAKVRNLGFHAFRRYVASILDDKHKASRKSIQKLLRHKKEATTEKYLYQIHSDLKDMAGMGVPEDFF